MIDIDMTNEALHVLDQKHYLPTFKRYPIALERGNGSRVWDVEGKEYVDALAGIAVSNIGHNHQALTFAISDQASKLIHTSNFYVTPPQMELASRLTKLSGLDRVFMANSGAEAVEGAMKIARKYAAKNGRGGTIITMKNAFHGRTLATIAATGKEAMLNGFDPIMPGFSHSEFNNIEMIESMIDDSVAGIMLEVVQGEGGINLVDADYLRQLRALCDKHHMALILDEVQCGMGRTGKMFAYEHYHVKPDIVTLAKGLAGGVPIGAVLAVEHVAQAIDWGDHGTTFGGNPLACRAALAVIEVIEQENLLTEAIEKGARIKEQLNQERSNYPEILEVRGLGLMIGVQLSVDAKQVVRRMLDHGVLSNATGNNVVRLVPPLNIVEEDIEQILKVLLLSIKELRTHEH
jgi:acetylornithine/N-succinyldiaminopimelate aminotransferase